MPSPRTTTPATSSGCRANKLKTMMEFEADRMTGLVLTDDVVKPELKVVLEEYNKRVANNPRARLGEQIEAALLSQPSLRQAGDRLAPRDRKAQPRRCAGFYRRFYTPNNAVLVVAGDVTPAEVQARRRDLRQGPAPTPTIGPRQRPQEPPQVAARRVTLADPRVRSRACSATISCRRHDRQARRSRGARSAGAYPRPRLEQPALPHAGGRQARSPSTPAPGTTAPRSTRPSSASTARRSPASRCRSSKPRSTR